MAGEDIDAKTLQAAAAQMKLLDEEGRPVFVPFAAFDGSLDQSARFDENNMTFSEAK